MSREDWEVFDIIKAERKAKRAERREAFTGGAGWTRYNSAHWSYTLNGHRLDYWPGLQRWRWRGKTMTGDVFSFIKKREAA